MKIIDCENTPNQGSLDWRRERLGKFTGSNISKLLNSGRKKEDVFGATAVSYITKVAAERHLNSAMVSDDDLFAVFAEQTEIYSKAIAWGHEQEMNARILFRDTIKHDVLIPSSVEHPEIENYAASPDGIVHEEDMVVEIKCPNFETAFLYSCKIKDGATLLEVKPEYYWQVQAEMDCTGASKCAFVVYCPFLAKPLHIVYIERNDEDINKLRERIKLANEYIELNFSK